MVHKAKKWEPGQSCERMYHVVVVRKEYGHFGLEFVIMNRGQWVANEA